MFSFPYLSIILCVRVCNCVPFITMFIFLVSTQFHAIVIVVAAVVVLFFTWLAHSLAYSHS